MELVAITFSAGRQKFFPLVNVPGFLEVGKIIL